VGPSRVTVADIRRFRQLNSKAPGHPEYHWVSGVETTLGPLGQGVRTSVGMPIAQKWLAHHYNRPGFEIFDYNIYAVCGDGCLMRALRQKRHHWRDTLVSTISAGFTITTTSRLKAA